MIQRDLNDFDLSLELKRAGYSFKDGYLVTALEIIAQMPIGTSLATLVDPKNTDTIWECKFSLPMMQMDSRFDKCPHKCAALAYIAWAKGKEL